MNGNKKYVLRNLTFVFPSRMIITAVALSGAPMYSRFSNPLLAKVPLS